jgi:ABC-type uncharacterized transport system involved in gliding motility auxiliary subunit
MNTNWLTAKQTKYTLYVAVYALIVIGALSLVNFLANRHNKSFDATANKRFSLSDQSIKVVKNLKGDAKITYFDQQSRFPQAKDLLDRYNNLSPKLTVDYIDPDKKPQVAKANAVRSYGTIYVDANGKREEAKSVTEEEITGALIRALKGGQRTICAVTGAGEHGLDDSGRDGYSQLKEVAERNNYKTQSVSLIDKPQVPAECTILVVGGPRFDYVTPVVNAIKTYVEGGGRALIMVDPPVKLGNNEVSQNAELLKLLESWGVTANKDLILDTSPIGQLFGFGAAVPLVASYESHAIVREMKEVATAFPMARSLDVKNGDKTTVEKLFSSSANSYATTNLSSAEVEINPAKDKKGPLAIGAAGTYRTGQENKNGRFVVTGSSQWASNSILRFNGNRDLAMNILNWLSSDEDLISIRPKDPENRPLNMSAAQMRNVFYASVLLMPLLVIGAGLRVWWKRR